MSILKGTYIFPLCLYFFQFSKYWYLKFEFVSNTFWTITKKQPLHCDRHNISGHIKESFSLLFLQVWGQYGGDNSLICLTVPTALTSIRSFCLSRQRSQKHLTIELSQSVEHQRLVCQNKNE